MKSSRPLPESNEYADTEKLVASGRYANLPDGSKVNPNGVVPTVGVNGEPGTC